MSLNTRIPAFFLAAICWNLIVSIDSTALSTALPTIAKDLDATSTQAFWCGTAFVLASAVAQPVISSSSEAFGRKPLIFFSILMFALGNTVCGLSQDVMTLITGRCLQGVGGGGLLTMTYVLMADELSLQQRHKAITAISLTWLVGPVVGPILSGGFTETLSWRWIFWFNGPFCILALIILLFMQFTYQPPVQGLERIKRLDFVGATLLVTSLTAFLVAISWGGTMFAWSSWQTLVPLLLGLGGIAAWTFYTLHLTATPMIPLRLILDNRTALISYFGNLFHGLVFYGVLYYFPLYLQAVQGLSPLMSGVVSLPTSATAGPAAAVAGLLIARYQRIKPLILVGWCGMIGGLALMVILGESSSTATWVCIQIPSGLSLGLLYASLALATQAAVESSSTKTPEEIIKVKGIAAGLNPFFRTVGQTLGIVISQAAFTNAIKAELGQSAASNATALATFIKAIPLGNPLRRELIHGFAKSLHPVWYTLTGVAAFALLLTFATKDVGQGYAVKTDIESTSSSCSTSIIMKEETPAGRKGSLFGFTQLFQEGVSEGFHHDSWHVGGLVDDVEEKKKGLIVTVREL